MIDPGELIETAVALIGVLGTAAKTATWAIKKSLESKEKREAQLQAFLASQEAERKDALAMVHAQHMEESKRCQEASLALVKRLEEVQDRQAQYDREDRSRLITVLDRAVEATTNSTRAYDRLTERLNDTGSGPVKAISH